MKKVIVVGLFLLLTMLLQAEFKVTYKPKLISNHIGLTNLSNKDKYDSEGNLCALLIVNTGLTNLNCVNSSAKVAMLKKDGAYWVTLKDGANYIQFKKSGFGNYKERFSTSLKGGSVYEMSLSSTQTGLVNAGEDLNSLIIKLNTSDVVIKYDSYAPLKATSNTVQFKLALGEYNFNFSKDGYSSVDKLVSVHRGTNEISIKLQEGESIQKQNIPGIIIVDSNPTGAEVFLNGQKVGVTPYQAINYEGDYQITLKKDLYYSVDKSFNLKATETLTLPVETLKPKYGTISINSNPIGAKINLNGKKIGVTPLKKRRVKSGSYQLELELKDYQLSTKQFDIQDGDVEVLNEELKPNFAKVTISSSPQAKLFIDDTYVGNTPYVSDKVLAGSYNLRVEKELWLSSSETINVIADIPLSKELVLTKNFGTIKVTALGSEIYVNSEMSGVDEIELNRTPGSYEIRAKRDKYVDATKTVIISSGEIKNIELNPTAEFGTLSILAVEKYNKEKIIRGAKIYLDGKELNKTTPSIIQSLYGSYDLTLTHPGFLDSNQKVTFVKNKNREITCEMFSYKGSLQSKHDSFKRKSWISGTTALILTGTAFYLGISAEQNHEDYLNSTTTTDALNYRDETEKLSNYRDYSYYSASTLGLYSLYTWIRATYYNSKLN